MDKTNIRKILTSVLAVLLIFSMFSETAFALSGDGSHIGHTGGGSSVSGAYLVPSSNSDHHVGFRFTWLTLGTDGYYSRKAALDVFYKGYNPNSSWGYHIKATVNGTTYRNLSKYEYKRYYDSLTIDREYYSTSTAYKYCNRTDIPVTLPADEDAMTTWGKKEANMNIILNKMVSGATVANMKSSDYIFIEPLYRVKIENTNYCITVTEMGLIGCVVCSATSTGNEGSGYGSGWVTIRRYTNLNWPDALKTDSAHAGISAGTTLSSATSFQNLVNKGYGLMVVWNTNPHLLTVYYTTGTGDASLKISSNYKLASNFTSYSSSYIRNSSDNYFTQSVYYDNNLTLMNGAGSGFKMTRDYYTFSKWQKNGTTSYFNGGSTHKASALNSNVATGNTDVTFTAVWTPKEYTITYNLNGGKIGTSSTNPTQKYTYETDVYIGNYSSGATAYATPSKDGYDFSGWKYTAATIGYWTKDNVYANRYNKGQYEHGDITLYAQWTPKSYTVTYNANGGSGAPGSQTKTYGNDLTLSSTKPTRNGYTFVSWNTKADGKGTTYASGGKYTGNANLTLYAIWNPITYSVKYNGNGATSGSMSNQSHTYDTSKNLTANAFKRAFTVTYNYNGNGQSNSTATANATFGGWATSASGSKVYNDKQSVKNLSSTQGATVNLYAKWTDASVTLPSPTRTGYVLNGWYTAASGGTKIGNGGASYTPTGNITLYAQWSPISYTVKFNGNGSTAGSMSNQGFTFDKEQNLTANAFTRAFVVTYNYNGNGSANSSATANATFNGWATSASGAKTYNDKQSVKNLSSTQGATVNLYAKWTDGSVTLPTPTRTGYTLKGWYTAASSGTKVGDGGAKYTPSANVTLYAQWTPITYSVKFNGNGATSGSMSNQSHTYDTAKNLTANAFKREFTVTFNYNGNGKSNTSSKATASFSGWATSASGAKAYNDKQSVKNLSSTQGATVNLYAKWTDGSVTLPTATRTGYALKGWYTAASGGTKVGDGGASYKPSANVTLYAQWTPISYVVKFNGNGATSGSMSNQGFIYDAAQNLTANAFKRAFTVTYNYNGNGQSNSTATANATFNGWATSASGSKVYNDKQSVKNLSSTAGATVNLYAKWTDGSVTLPTPTRTGYTFSGWYTAASGGTKIGAGGAKYTPTNNITLYAQWSPITYSVKFNGNGSTSGSMSDQKMTYDKAANLTANAFKRAFVVTFNYNGNGQSNTTSTANAAFNGWATSATGQNAYNDKQSVKNLTATANASVNLYAKWTDASVTLPTPTRTGYIFNGWFTASSGGTKIGTGGASYTPSKDITLYAQWSPITYTIKFVGNGSTSGSMANMSMTYDVAKNLTDNAFKRTGYSFTGWNTKADGSGTKYTNKQSVKNLTTTNGATITLYAQWTPDSYTIKFNGNGSTSGSMSDLKMTYDVAKNLTANAFKKTGHTFKNWNTKADGTGTSYADKQSVKNLPVASGNTITLYAQWTPISYSIQFNGNGSTSGTMANLAMTYDVAKNLTANTFKKTGYVFSGWATTATGKVTYSDKQSVKNLTTTNGATITLYAVWTPITYTIKFNGNGSSSGSMSNLAMVYDTAKALTANAYKRTGYSFNGWNTAADGSGAKYTDKQSVKNLTTTQGATVNLYAQWTPISYAVKFNGNGSTSGSMANQSFVYDKAQNLSANAFKREFTITYNYNYSGAANTTAKASATFNGWATSTSGKVVYTDKQSVKNLSSTSGAVVNVYAKWTDKAVTLPTPTRTGYVFDGWYTSASSGNKIGSGGGSYTPSKDITVYAHWTPISYTIKFNGNGSTSGTMSNLSMTYDVAKTLTANAYKRTGYTYVGWNTKADGTGTVYSDKQSVKNLTATQGATINLYAQWKPIGYSVKFNGNGSTSGSMSNQAFVYDVAQNLTANAFKREFTITYNYNYAGKTNTTGKATAAFNGWATSATGNVVYSDKQNVKNLSATSGAVVSVYAKWSDAKATLPTPTRTGYTFDGWYTTATGGTKIGGGGSSYTTDKDITVYAHWTPITYTIKFDGNKATSGSMANLSMTYDVEKSLTANAYVRTGYIFTGWNTAVDGKGTAYTDKQAVKNLTATDKAIITLYAQWNPVGYSVKFNGNGATSGSMTNQSFVYDVAQNLTANAFKREFTITYNYNYAGKTNTTGKATAAFNGWATSATGSVVYSDKQNVKNLSATSGAVVNVYAKWSDAKAILPTPTRTGYTFDGWYTTATDGTKIGGGGSSYTTDKDVTVYAHWTPITYTIHFDGNMATSGTMSNLSMTYDVEKSLTANAYVRTGYIFTGWNTAADGKVASYTDKQTVKNLTATDKATITLYAQWKPISYTIRFNGNGASSGSMSDMTMTYDVEKTLTANAFVKNAAEFVKWNTKADGTGTDYADKQAVKNLTTENGKVITLYAQWKNLRELSLEAITPNAAYRESTEVITSFNLVNKGEGVCLPSDNVSVVFKVYKDSTVIKTVTQTGVVVPGNERNLLFFKWTVPTNLGSSKIYVSGEIVENNSSYGLIKNQYATCKYNVYATPDTQYEASAPDGFTVPGTPTAKSDTAKWSVWTYENNAFKKLNYGMSISDAAATITPDESANAEQQGGVWVMKSGYGYGISLNNGVKTLSGYTAAPAAAYTNAQYALALFPEFGYAQTSNNCRTLELTSGKWMFRENSDYGRIHFTPLWYPDGNYTAAVLQSDCWTPAGMISRMCNTNTITISGSAYDDWFIG